MTVEELIKELNKLPGDTIVRIPCMDSYGYFDRFDTVAGVEIESDGSNSRQPGVSLIPWS